MKGQTCGLCGKADGEVRQELRMPSGYVTKSAVSYAHSWVQPGKSCRDSSGKYGVTNMIFFHTQSGNFTFLLSFHRVLDEAQVCKAG